MTPRSCSCPPGPRALHGSSSSRSAAPVRSSPLLESNIPVSRFELAWLCYGLVGLFNAMLLADDFAYADVNVKVDDGFTLTNSVTVSLFPLDADTVAALVAQASTRAELQGIETNFDIKIQKKSLRQIQKAMACIQ